MRVHRGNEVPRAASARTPSLWRLRRPDKVVLYGVSVSDNLYKMPKINKSTDELLIQQLKEIARGLAHTFAPFCEVVLHDLRDPSRTIVLIENNLSGRAIGDPTTELGLARAGDDSYPQVIANYSNRLTDGRQVKSTSVGVKGSDGNYVAALCLNIDVSVFNGAAKLLQEFTHTDTVSIEESLEPANAEMLRDRIDTFAARHSTTPQALSKPLRRKLSRDLKSSGYLDLRRSVEVVAEHLGVSRATVYADIKKESE